MSIIKSITILIYPRFTGTADDGMVVMCYRFGPTFYVCIVDGNMNYSTWDKGYLFITENVNITGCYCLVIIEEVTRDMKCFIQAKSDKAIYNQSNIWLYYVV